MKRRTKTDCNTALSEIVHSNFVASSDDATLQTATPKRWIDTVPADRIINLPSNPADLTAELVKSIFTPEHLAACARELARLVHEAQSKD